MLNAEETRLTELLEDPPGELTSLIPLLGMRIDLVIDELNLRRNKD